MTIRHKGKKRRRTATPCHHYQPKNLWSWPTRIVTLGNFANCEKPEAVYQEFMEWARANSKTGAEEDLLEFMFGRRISIQASINIL